MSFLTRSSADPAPGSAYPSIELNQQAYGSFQADDIDEEEADFDLTTLLPSSRSSFRERPSFSDGDCARRFCPPAPPKALWNALSVLNLLLIIALCVLGSFFYFSHKQNRKDIKLLGRELVELKQASNAQYSSLYLELSKLRSREDAYKTATDDLFTHIGLNITAVEVIV
jgi:hypothetical protein